MVAMTFGDYLFKLFAGDNAQNVSVLQVALALVILLIVAGVGFLILLDDHRELKKKMWKEE